MFQRQLLLPEVNNACQLSKFEVGNPEEEIDVVIEKMVELNKKVGLRLNKQAMSEVAWFFNCFLVFWQEEKNLNDLYIALLRKMSNLYHRETCLFVLSLGNELQHILIPVLRGCAILKQLRKDSQSLFMFARGK